MEKKLKLTDLSPTDSSHKDLPSSLINQLDRWLSIDKSANYLWQCMSTVMGENIRHDMMLFLNIAFRFISALNEKHPETLDILEEEFKKLLQEVRNGKKINS